jgi:hypothetical protein
METTGKNWYIDIDGTTYEATTETIDQWIWDGTVLSQHKVSRGGQRWLEAGKVPRFSEHFANAQQMQDLLGTEGVGVTTKMMASPVMPPPMFEEQRSRMPSEVAANAPQPFGVKLFKGSAIALVIALAAGYFWAYNISSPKDLALINTTPEMKNLQSKYDNDKTTIEQAKAATPAPARVSTPVTTRASQLGPAKTGDIADRKGFKGFNMPEMPVYTPPSAPDLSAMFPKRDYDGEVANLTAQFETDKKKIVETQRGADTRSRFYQTFVLLFLGLAGLNLARLSIFPGRK